MSGLQDKMDEEEFVEPNLDESEPTIIMPFKQFQYDSQLAISTLQENTDLIGEPLHEPELDIPPNSDLETPSFEKEDQKPSKLNLQTILQIWK
jgi:hypothetical protein